MGLANAPAHSRPEDQASQKSTTTPQPSPETPHVAAGTDRLKDGARGAEYTRSQPMTLESIGYR